MANLFTSQTPTGTDGSDGAPGIVTATTVVFAVDGTVTGVRFYATTTVSGTYIGGLWTVDSSDPGGGTLLQQKTLPAPPTPGTWNTYVFDTPIAVTAGVVYRVGSFSGAGRYVFTGGFFSSAGLTNGSISAPQHNTITASKTITQGSFRIDASFDYPNANGNGSCYFVDPEFTPAPGALTPTGLAVPVAFGSPVATFSASAAPGGLAVPVALGSPALTWTASAAPTGVSVPVALGTPVVRGLTVAPAGLAVPVELGTPAATFTAAPLAPEGLAVPVALGQPSVRGLVVYPSGLAVGVGVGQPTVVAPDPPAPDVPQGGSWDGLLAVVNSAREDHRVNQERLRHPVECPYDGWPLKQARGVYHCEFGGHIVTPSY